MLRTVLEQDSRIGGAAKRPGDQSRKHDGGGAQETQRGLQSTGERQKHTDRAAYKSVRDKNNISAQCEL